MLTRTCMICGEPSGVHVEGCLQDQLDHQRELNYELSSLLEELLVDIRPSDSTYYTASRAVEILQDPELSRHANRDQLLLKLAKHVEGELTDKEELGGMHWWAEAEQILVDLLKLSTQRS